MNITKTSDEQCNSATPPKSGTRRRKAINVHQRRQTRTSSTNVGYFDPTFEWCLNDLKCGFQDDMTRQERLKHVLVDHTSDNATMVMSNVICASVISTFKILIFSLCVIELERVHCAGSINWVVNHHPKSFVIDRRTIA